MQVHQREHEALDVLHQVEEDDQSLGVCRFLHVRERPDLRCPQAEFLFAHPDVYLLLSDFVGFGPILVAFFHYPTLKNDPLHLVDDCLRYEHLLADEGVAFVLRVVEVLEFAGGVKFEVQVLVAVGSFVANVVAEEELFGFVFHVLFIRVE